MNIHNDVTNLVSQGWYKIRLSAMTSFLTKENWLCGRLPGKINMHVFRLIMYLQNPNTNKLDSLDNFMLKINKLVSI